MDRAISLLFGAGLGAGLMYLFDPRNGRRRRALARDQMTHLAHRAENAANVVAKDLRNRAQGLASGDLSVLVGGKRALEHPFQGGWSPSARGLMVLLGSGLFLYGLTEKFPTACILGTAGLALATEGFINVGIDDIAQLSESAACMAREAAERTSEALGLDGRTQHAGQENRESQLVGAAR